MMPNTQVGHHALHTAHTTVRGAVLESVVNDNFQTSPEGLERCAVKEMTGAIKFWRLGCSL